MGEPTYYLVSLVHKLAYKAIFNKVPPFSAKSGFSKFVLKYWELQKSLNTHDRRIPMGLRPFLLSDMTIFLLSKPKNSHYLHNTVA